MNKQNIIAAASMVYQYESKCLKYEVFGIPVCFHVFVVDPSQKKLHLSCKDGKIMKVILCRTKKRRVAEMILGIKK